MTASPPATVPAIEKGDAVFKTAAIVALAILPFLFDPAHAVGLPVFFAFH